MSFLKKHVAKVRAGMKARAAEKRKEHRVYQAEYQQAYRAERMKQAKAKARADAIRKAQPLSKKLTRFGEGASHNLKMLEKSLGADSLPCYDPITGKRTRK